MHMRAPLGTRIEVSGRIATLVSDSIEELLPGQVENIVSNCGLPVGPHNLAFIPTPTIGPQDCDLTILLKNEKSPVWDYRRILRKGLKERYPGTEFTFQPSDLTAKILNFGAPAPIDVQINGPDMYPNYEFARKLAGKFREIPGAADVVIQQTMRTPTLMVEGNRTFGLGVNRTQKDMADNLLMTTAGSQQVDQTYWLDPSTGMSYLINVYTPQSQINSINSLKTIPVESSSYSSNRTGDAAARQFGRHYQRRERRAWSRMGTSCRCSTSMSLPKGATSAVCWRMSKRLPIAWRTRCPSSAALEIHGQAALMHDAYFELIFGLLAAIVLVYLLIVVNFQSWLDPFIIITALPGALAGIAWALFLTHTRLSEPALTGAIMTMGTATANSILVVSYARERLTEHGDALRAAIEAGTTRFRPVLMTASAMIIGMVPMATGYSAECAAGSRRHRRLDSSPPSSPCFSCPASMRSSITGERLAKRTTHNMDKILRGKLVVISAILLCVLYLGYRIYESKSDAALLREKTLEDAVPTVAVIYRKAGAADRDHYAPRQYCRLGLRRRSTRRSRAM